MENVKVTFKVAMDKEQAELKNHKDVTFEVEFPAECQDQLVQDALKSQIIKWQSQIRNNWDKFIEEGVASKVVYGDSLYEGKRRTVVRPPTDDDVENFIIGKLTTEGIMYLATEGKMPPKEVAEYWK